MATLVCCLLLAGSAHGQTTPSWMHVRPQLLTAATAGGARVADPYSRARQDRARAILAAGIGVALSSAVMVSYGVARDRPCWTDPTAGSARSVRLAGAFGGAGLAAAVGGGSWLWAESRRHGHHATRLKRLGAAGVGAVTFVLTQAVLGGLFLADQICHS